MIEWSPEKRTEDFGYYLSNRLKLSKEAIRIRSGLVDLDFAGINLEVSFRDIGGERYLLIDVMPHVKGLDGLLRYIEKEVKTEKIFSEREWLRFIGNKREFRKYGERLEFVVANGETSSVPIPHIVKVSINYRIKECMLALSGDSFQETTHFYALAPLLEWAVRKR